MRKHNGFSLIELLIVMAITLIIAAMAIPGLLRSRTAANEASAVYSLRNINTAQIAYASTYPTLGFAVDLATLGPGDTHAPPPSSANAMLLDGVLGAASPGGNAVGTANPKSGYKFYISNTSGAPISTFTAHGDPVAYAQTGNRYFLIDSSGVVRYNATQIASSSDSALQ